LEAATQFSEQRVNTLQNFLNGFTPSQENFIKEEVIIVEGILFIHSTIGSFIREVT